MANLQNNFLLKYSEVVPNSNQWALLQYKLQLSLGSTTPVISKIWNITNPNATSKFDINNKGKLMVDSFLQTSALDQNNRLQKLCQKGFDISSEGMKFTTGFMKVNQSINKTYSFLFCKLAIGKSYCLPIKNIKKQKLKLNEGFDSIYLYNEEENPETFKHEYLIFNNQKILPSFLVNFQFDPKREKSLKPPLCDDCGDNIARLYCQTQQANFCTQCDTNNHRSKLTSKHRRVDINQRPKGFGQCHQHQGIKLELFCKQCNLPLCINCKINGDHSNGENSLHPIVRISEAYAAAAQKSLQIQPNLQKRKDKLAELLNNIDIKIKQINKNASVVEEQIYIVLQNSLKQLQQITQKKMSFLIGDQLQLKRQYDQIQWMESFLKYQYQILSPNQFLSVWARHLRYRKQVLGLSNIPIITDVKADMKLQGKIKIMIQQFRDNPRIMNQINEINLLQQKKIQNPESSYTSPNKSNNKSMQIGSTPFRRNIFNKHQIDKNSMLMKSSQNMNIKNINSDTLQSPIKSNSNNLRLAALKFDQTQLK